MSSQSAYAEKLPRLINQTGIGKLPEAQREFLQSQALIYRFTLQELQQLNEISLDLNMWRENPIEQIWPTDVSSDLAPKQKRQEILGLIRRHWEDLRQQPNQYPVSFDKTEYQPDRIKRVMVERPKLGLGYCPVASSRTRCCNLLTLDAVENCGFDCSYCSIQSFYHGDEVRFDNQFAEKLAQLEIDPDRIYHIGTGQSSDSLMWGNQAGILDALSLFATEHPNVILELKTKSKNISYLEKNPLPANIICTWSLNTQTLITHEEHLSASLEDRLMAARRLANKGIIVGFHLHPMIHYARWREDYTELFERMTSLFDPDEVALVSIGTLTYIKPVIKKLRGRRDFHSKILQMPMVESDGKLSYPEEIKLEMFSHAYQQLAPWHDKVFFYLCMENQRLWKPVFGFEYASNDAFELAMKASYLAKIEQHRQGSCYSQD